MGDRLEAGTYDGSEDREKYIIDYPGHLKFSLSASHQVSPRFQAFLSVQDLFNNGATEIFDYYVNKSRVSKFGLRIRS